MTPFEPNPTSNGPFLYALEGPKGVKMGSYEPNPTSNGSISVPKGGLQACVRQLRGSTSLCKAGGIVSRL